jgi:ribosomal protein L10
VQSNAELRVVKNTLAKRAVADAGIEGLDDLLEGPTSLVFCADDPVGPAKTLKKFSKDHPDLVIRGGYLDGAVMDAEETSRLADLASREELLAKLAGLMQGALAGFARLLQAPLAHQARLIQALIDDRIAKGESAPPPRPPSSRLRPRPRRLRPTRHRTPTRRPQRTLRRAPTTSRRRRPHRPTRPRLTRPEPHPDPRSPRPAPVRAGVHDPQEEPRWRS